MVSSSVVSPPVASGTAVVSVVSLSVVCGVVVVSPPVASGTPVVSASVVVSLSLVVVSLSVVFGSVVVSKSVVVRPLVVNGMVVVACSSFWLVESAVLTMPSLVAGGLAVVPSGALVAPSLGGGGGGGPLVVL